MNAQSVAAAAGLTLDDYLALEAGARRADAVEITKITHLLGCSMEDLFEKAQNSPEMPATAIADELQAK